MRRFWIVFLAFFRLSNSAVCEASYRMGLKDYHQLPDDAVGTPNHLVKMRCKRCGKEFI